MRGSFLAQMEAYATDPTIENAIALFRALQIPLPYEGFYGSMLDSTQRRVRSRASKGGEFGPYRTTNDVFKLMERLDVLHDLRPFQSPIEDEIMDRVLQDTTITPEERNAICKMDHMLDGSMTFRMAHWLCNDVLHMSTHQAHFDKEHLAITGRQLYFLVSQWRAQKETWIVMDGVLRAPAPDAPRDDYTTWRSISMYAFVMLILGTYNPNIPALPLQHNQPPASGSMIIFATGGFQTLDMPSFERNMHAWIGHLNKICSRIGVRVSIQTPLGPLLRPLGSVDLIPSDTWYPTNAIVDSTSIPGTNPVPILTQESLSTLARMRVLVSRMHVAYQKEYLWNVMNTYRRLPPAERPEFDAFLDRLFKINAFRDQYKADVAIQTGAVYITIDRMASIYYELRARLRGVLGQGLFIGVCGPDDMYVETFMRPVADSAPPQSTGSKRSSRGVL